jgi:hypothetical protein
LVQSLSQFETEALGLMFCLLKEEPILAFNNSTFHTDARSLCFITRYASATSKIYLWDMLLKSYNIEIEFTPNTNALIRLSDLMTRGIGKTPFKGKISQEDLDSFLQIDFQVFPI